MNKDKSKLHEAVRNLKREINALDAAAKLTVEGPVGIKFGPASMAALNRVLQDEETPPPAKSKPTWLTIMRGWIGKGEGDSVFVKYMSTFWKFVGLPNFNTIIGSKFAWCGTGAAAALIVAGYAYQHDGAGAKNWDKYGQRIEYKVNGIPAGALVRINHNFSCSSGTGNHISMSNTDCTAEDIAKKGATIPLVGANQGNKVKISYYSTREICEVRWPSKDAKGNAVPLPPKVTKSEDCSGKASTGESTR